jgi:hypothetical protein
MQTHVRKYKVNVKDAYEQSASISNFFALTEGFPSMYEQETGYAHEPA